jgi:hypothetical protein
MTSNDDKSAPVGMVREPKNHVIKCWTGYFDAVRAGRKTFEVRKDDRDYQEGDAVTLLDFDPVTEQLSGRQEVRRIGYLARAGLIPGGYCVFALLAAPPAQPVTGCGKRMGGGLAPLKCGERTELRTVLCIDCLPAQPVTEPADDDEDQLIPASGGRLFCGRVKCFGAHCAACITVRACCAEKKCSPPQPVREQGEGEEQEVHSVSSVAHVVLKVLEESQLIGRSRKATAFAVVGALGPLLDLGEPVPQTPAVSATWAEYHRLLNLLCSQLRVPGSPTFESALGYVKDKLFAQQPLAVLPVETPRCECRHIETPQWTHEASCPLVRQPSPTAGPGPVPIGGLEDALRCGRIWAESGSPHLSVPEHSAAALARELDRLRAAAPPRKTPGELAREAMEAPFQTRLWLAISEYCASGDGIYGNVRRQRAVVRVNEVISWLLTENRQGDR